MYYALSENLSECLETLLDIQIKGNGLISLAEEIPKQSNVEATMRLL